jgi:predicted ATP-grasp superfamily ATP-dependent carboligase
MTKQKLTLVGIHGRPSMKKVFDQMTANNDLIVRRRIRMKNGGRKVYYRLYKNNDSSTLTKVQEPPQADNTVMIRWGTRESINTSGSSIVYNKIEGLEKATDKGLSRRLMQEGGVRVPKNVTPENVSRVDFPIIARPQVHAKGRNFVTFNDVQSFQRHYHAHARSGWYYSAFVDKDREYRVHIGHGKVLALMEKSKPTDSKIAWNRAQNEEPFTYVGYGSFDDPGIKDAIIESIKAVKVLGLDFGGVDVMVKDNVAYVLEINTSPTLTSCDYTAGKWAQYFDWLYRSDKRREHFDRIDYKKGRNFFFWNEQLAN